MERASIGLPLPLLPLPLSKPANRLRFPRLPYRLFETNPKSDGMTLALAEAEKNTINAVVRAYPPKCSRIVPISAKLEEEFARLLSWPVTDFD